MAPTLPGGDIVAVDELAYATAPPQRGDIVILVPPDQPRQVFDKRVIGIPGDTLEIDVPQVQNGLHRAFVLIKPVGATGFIRLNEPYLPDQTKDPWTELTFCCDPTGRATTQAEPLVIPPEQYFVLGDDRNRSRDSRSIGLIPQAKIQGKVTFVLSPSGVADIYSKLPSLGGG